MIRLSHSGRCFPTDRGSNTTTNRSLRWHTTGDQPSNTRRVQIRSLALPLIKGGHCRGEDVGSRIEERECLINQKHNHTGQLNNEEVKNAIIYLGIT